MIATTVVLLTMTTNARPYLDAAKMAAAWIRAEESRIKSTDLTLYSGKAGVLIFFAELARATGDRAIIREVDLRANELSKRAETFKEPGLYTGLGGVAFALDTAASATGNEAHRKAARNCMDRVLKMANPVGKGIEWSSSTDIVSGSAGIGLMLLYGIEKWGRLDVLQQAKSVGDRLIELGRKESTGTSWAMDPAFPRMMPNFSHGTAGVAYFLARLGIVSKESKFLDSARAGADYLLSITAKDGLIYHHTPDGLDLFYLGWCHGPVGTSRLFAILHKTLREPKYASWIDHASEKLLKCGLPQQRTPGFWNNWGYCCGDAGVLRFFLDLYRLDEKSEHIAMARKLANRLISLAEPADGGYRWTFAENRVSPKETKAQTGLMQGAAGIGLALLWLDAYDQKRDALVRMPDAPWRW